MTQKYYVDNLLPVYVNAIQEARMRPGGELKPWLFQEEKRSSTAIFGEELDRHIMSSSSIARSESN